MNKLFVLRLFAKKCNDGGKLWAVLCGTRLLVLVVFMMNRCKNIWQQNMLSACEGAAGPIISEC